MSGVFIIAIYLRLVDKNRLVSFFYTIINDSESILELYRDFEDIFSKKDAGKLP